MSLSKQPNQQQENNHFQKESDFPDAVSKILILSGIAIIIAALINILACNPKTIDIVKTATVTVTDCAFHTSVACAAQSTAGCAAPDESGNFGEYAECLVEKSKSCSSKGLGLCLLKGLTSAARSSFVVAGGVGCVEESNLETIRQCVLDTTMETEREAVNAVAYCYRSQCIGESYAD